MKKYEVNIEVTHFYSYEIEAKNKRRAKQKAIECAEIELREPDYCRDTIINPIKIRAKKSWKIKKAPEKGL